MKKLPIVLLILAIIYLSMTFFVANVAEKEIKLAFSENGKSDFSIELINYQRHFFTANVISKVSINIDPETTITFDITSHITHYLYQAVIKSNIQIEDDILAKKAELYFGTEKWLTSEEKINLFSQLSGVLSLASGKYEGESESLTTEPLLLSYQVDLKDRSADVQLDWAGLTGVTHDTTIALNTLQFSSHLGTLNKRSDGDYKLTVKNVTAQQKDRHSLLEGLLLQGYSKQGKKDKTVNTSNELLVRSYQINNDKQKTFLNNRIKFGLTGLYQPAFERLNSGADDKKEVENALFELIHHGAKLTLSQLNSQTPWGEVDGKFDLTLAQGASLMDLVANPYILFDYISGNASLVLPASLLQEPLLAESLQMGLMTGFLLQKEQTLNLQSSFQQGELIVNGQVIPL